MFNIARPLIIMFALMVASCSDSEAPTSKITGLADKTVDNQLFTHQTNFPKLPNEPVKIMLGSDVLWEGETDQDGVWVLPKEAFSQFPDGEYHILIGGSERTPVPMNALLDKKGLLGAREFTALDDGVYHAVKNISDEITKAERTLYLEFVKQQLALAIESAPELASQLWEMEGVASAYQSGVGIESVLKKHLSGLWPFNDRDQSFIVSYPISIDVTGSGRIEVPSANINVDFSGGFNYTGLVADGKPAEVIITPQSGLDVLGWIGCDGRVSGNVCTVSGKSSLQAFVDKEGTDYVDEYQSLNNVDAWIENGKIMINKYEIDDAAKAKLVVGGLVSKEGFSEAAYRILNVDDARQDVIELEVVVVNVGETYERSVFLFKHTMTNRDVLAAQNSVRAQAGKPVIEYQPGLEIRLDDYYLKLSDDPDSTEIMIRELHMQDPKGESPLQCGAPKTDFEDIAICPEGGLCTISEYAIGRNCTLESDFGSFEMNGYTSITIMATVFYKDEPGISDDILTLNTQVSLLAKLSVDGKLSLSSELNYPVKDGKFDPIVLRFGQVPLPAPMTAYSLGLKGELSTHLSAAMNGEISAAASFGQAYGATVKMSIDGVKPKITPIPLESTEPYVTGHGNMHVGVSGRFAFVPYLTPTVIGRGISLKKAADIDIPLAIVVKAGPLLEAAPANDLLTHKQECDDGLYMLRASFGGHYGLESSWADTLTIGGITIIEDIPTISPTPFSRTLASLPMNQENPSDECIVPRIVVYGQHFVDEVKSPDHKQFYTVKNPTKRGVEVVITTENKTEYDKMNAYQMVGGKPYGISNYLAAEQPEKKVVWLVPLSPGQEKHFAFNLTDKARGERVSNKITFHVDTKDVPLLHFSAPKPTEYKVDVVVWPQRALPRINLVNLKQPSQKHRLIQWDYDALGKSWAHTSVYTKLTITETGGKKRSRSMRIEPGEGVFEQYIGSTGGLKVSLENRSDTVFHPPSVQVGHVHVLHRVDGRYDGFYNATCRFLDGTTQDFTAPVTIDIDTSYDGTLIDFFFYDPNTHARVDHHQSYTTSKDVRSLVDVNFGLVPGMPMTTTGVFVHDDDGLRIEGQYPYVVRRVGRDSINLCGITKDGYFTEHAGTFSVKKYD